MMTFQEIEIHKIRLALNKDYQEGKITPIEHLEQLSIIAARVESYEEDELNEYIEANCDEDW